MRAHPAWRSFLFPPLTRAAGLANIPHAKHGKSWETCKSPTFCSLFRTKALYLQREAALQPPHAISTRNGQTHTTTAPQVHGFHSLEGYEARTHRAQIPLATRLPLPSEQSPTTGASRSCAEKIPHLCLRAWLFLAWARGLQILQTSPNPHRLLGKQNKEKPRTGHPGAAQVSRHGLARDCRMGM